MIALLQQGKVDHVCTEMNKLLCLAAGSPVVQQLGSEHVNKPSTDDDGQKVRRRKPNAYNKFVSETMKMLARERRDLSSKQCMTVAVQMWKSRNTSEQDAQIPPQITSQITPQITP
jgi:hypothetical protein